MSRQSKWDEAKSLVSSGKTDEAISLLKRAIGSRTYRLQQWPTSMLADIYRDQKNYSMECKVIERLLTKTLKDDEKHNTSHLTHLKHLQERLVHANARLAGEIDQSGRGKCEACENEDRVLTKIESGQWVCSRWCLHEIRGTRGPCEYCDANPRVLKKLHDGRMVCNKCDKILKAYNILWSMGVRLSRKSAPGEAQKTLEDSEKAYYYVLDLWEAERGVRIIHDPLAGSGGRAAIHRFSIDIINKDRRLLSRIAAVQVHRDKVAADSFAKMPPNERPPWDSLLRPSLKRDNDYLKIVELLTIKWPGLRDGRSQ